MNDTQITLVKESWAKVAPIAPTAAALFYDRLFTLAPGVRPLFADDMTEQKRKLIEMLDRGRRRPRRSRRDRPRRRGPRPPPRGLRRQARALPVVGECLLWTLGQGSAMSSRRKSWKRGPPPMACSRRR